RGRRAIRMTIEVHRPELEALIRERMKSGAFQNVEDVLMQALQSSVLTTGTTKNCISAWSRLAKLSKASPFYLPASAARVCRIGSTTPCADGLKAASCR